MSRRVFNSRSCFAISKLLDVVQIKPPWASWLQAGTFHYSLISLIFCRNCIIKVPGAVSKCVCSPEPLDWKYLRLYLQKNQSCFPAATEREPTHTCISTSGKLCLPAVKTSIRNTGKQIYKKNSIPTIFYIKSALFITIVLSCSRAHGRQTQSFFSALFSILCCRSPSYFLNLKRYFSLSLSLLFS